ncbi:ImmA/IrrE family metallo-endopeptidase [Virgibacillus ihumii]|uniref:ImmA/IrrE family metallo-endopeptidase n=1 Tax=Virgibacillus ihumii TaxID=2686091 RepID=UPI00157D8556|nr:ImmA/IrrE family metallo-endopeptidase [Virgibacillus ihumii]
MFTIAKKLNINIVYRESNFSFSIENDIILVKSTIQQEWQNFCHELGHRLRHVGQQLKMHYLFRDLQEYQAENFAYHFCVPTFMLEKIENLTAYKIAILFNVEYEFASKRLEMYERKVLNERFYSQAW